MPCENDVVSELQNVSLQSNTIHCNKLYLTLVEENKKRYLIITENKYNENKMYT